MPAATKKTAKPRVEVGVEEARTRLGPLINRAGVGDERVVVSRHGFAVAAIVSIDDLNSLEKSEVA